MFGLAVALSQAAQLRASAAHSSEASLESFKMRYDCYEGGAQEQGRGCRRILTM